MLDIGWGELLIIGVVALIVVGPKDLPILFRRVGHFMGRARGMAREFQRSMEAAADESGLKEAAQGLKAIDRLNLNKQARSARSYAESLVKGIDEAAGGAAPAASARPGPSASPSPAPPAASGPAGAPPAAPAAAQDEAASAPATPAQDAAPR